MKNPWTVGGDEVLKRFIISRKARPTENASALEYVMHRREVKVFSDKQKAQAYADKLNGMGTMKNKRPKVVVIDIWQVRRLNKGVTPLDFKLDGSNSEWICNELSMDRAIDVADTEAYLGKICIIIPMTIVRPELDS